MSFSLTSTIRTRFARPGWAGVAFIVEALVLVIFLAAAVAIFTRLFSGAAAQSDEALRLARAVAAAQSTAERFAADPESVYTVEEADGGLTVVTEITRGETAAGTLYRAVISVYEGAPVTGPTAGGDSEGVWPADAGAAAYEDLEPLYRIETAAYRGGGAA